MPEENVPDPLSKSMDIIGKPLSIILYNIQLKVVTGQGCHSGWFASSRFMSMQGFQWLGVRMSYASFPSISLVNVLLSVTISESLQWRHNERDGVSNHQPHDCMLNRLFRRRSKKTSKLRVTGLCAGNAPVTDEFPAQRASNAENVSILWRHHVWCISRAVGYNDAMRLKRFSHYWSCVRIMHWLSVDCLHKEPFMRNLDDFCVTSP